MHKIGVLGGTFDPIHFGHLRIGLECKAALSLDELRMIPCAEPWHRNEPMASASKRLQMLSLALHNSNNVIADDRELQRTGASYTVDTLESLKSDFSNSNLYLIVGSDTFQKLNQWHRWQEIFELANIVIAQRPDCGNDKESTVGKILKQRFCSIDELKITSVGKIACVPVSQLEISASHIRGLIRDKNSIQYLLPDSVISLIEQEKLYSTGFTEVNV